MSNLQTKVCTPVDVPYHPFLSSAQQSIGVRQVLEAADDVTILTDQDLKSSQEISQTTEILTSQSEMLLREVDRFKLAKYSLDAV